MNDQQQYDRQYTNQGFPNYDGPIKSGAVGAGSGLLDRVFDSGIAKKLRNPVIGTAVLLLTGAVFAGIIISSYPGDGEQGVPVIKAQQTAFKTTPDNPGGINVPFEESTIFSTIRGDEGQADRPIENLLASVESEQAVDTASYFEAEENAAKAAAKIAPAAGGNGNGNADNQDVYFLEPSPPNYEKQKAENMALIKGATKTEAETIVAAATPAEKPVEVQTFEQKVEKVMPVDEFAGTVRPTQKPTGINKPGSAPDTLAFVRSVLDQKDTEKVLSAPITNANTRKDDQELAQRLSGIAPAAGAAAPVGNAIRPGSYYVQLASVGSETGAHGEWSKIQKSYAGVLQNASYRVKRADLDKGTFYRIQAGPMSKDNANAMCDEIKAQKPGGCLVTK